MDIKKTEKMTNNKHLYVCAICGTAYDTVAERSACEARCCEKKAIKEKQQRERELKKIYQSRKEEINKDIITLNQKIEKFNKDYPHSKLCFVKTVGEDNYSFADLLNMFGI